jgi:hypothetical protein
MLPRSAAKEKSPVTGAFLRRSLQRNLVVVVSLLDDHDMVAIAVVTMLEALAAPPVIAISVVIPLSGPNNDLRFLRVGR